MGYDIVRLNEKGDVTKVTEVNDDDYFRLNIWGMSEARQLAAWGAGAISNESMMKIFAQNKSTNTNQFVDMLQIIASIMTEMPEHSEKTPWLEPFTSNGNTASREQCWAFAEALSSAVDKITASPVMPDIDLDYIIDFIDYLNNSAHGVYVG